MKINELNTQLKKTNKKQKPSEQNKPKEYKKGSKDKSQD